jgi:hypothetical protein
MAASRFLGVAQSGGAATVKQVGVVRRRQNREEALYASGLRIVRCQHAAKPYRGQSNLECVRDAHVSQALGPRPPFVVSGRERRPARVVAAANFRRYGYDLLRIARPFAMCSQRGNRMAATRERLPNRREATTFDVEAGGPRYRATAGRYPEAASARCSSQITKRAAKATQQDRSTDS